MFETGRRSAISSSELGLYSDRSEYYGNNKYGPVVKKVVIGVMAVVAVILAAIFIYDFASGAVASSKVSQETKHAYILQNPLKKPNYLRKTTTAEPDRLVSDIQERSDYDGNISFVDTKPEMDTGRSGDLELPEMRTQNLENFKMRQRLRDGEDGDVEEKIESKEIVNNHAVVYRVRQMYHPEPDTQVEESKPTPFHFELKTPQPSSFKRLKFPQLTQYRYPYPSRNIQEIIKYLTNDPATTKHGIKFSGVYMNPKKYEYPQMGSLVANSDRSELPADSEEFEETDDETSHLAIGHDPFYPYKPNYPADVNLLAPANVRFSPSGVHRYNPYLESSYHRPMMLNRPAVAESHDNGVYSGSYGKRRKPKPFSVMLDIYPITELNDQPNKKTSRRPAPMSGEEYSESRRPITFGRANRYYANNPVTPIPLIAMPASQPGMSEEDEKKQMIFHLNLYPRKKNKLNRNDVLERSEAMTAEDKQLFAQKVMSPFDTITKQLTDQSAIEEFKFDADIPKHSPLISHQESFVEMPNEKPAPNRTGNFSNHKTEEPKNTEESKPSTESQNLADGLVAID
ncbi:uncharacterized protein LOC130668908 [Microplitis mediator]|uniref:uncharacterized protein LOC130668908 n=1 Tax=Microplitis mediator TaxID=375433 RepID=UPI002552CF72|nr:uncharacterized protein LOC130668908 [Microplitis mediator]